MPTPPVSKAGGRSLSAPVRSNQEGPHPRLASLVARHLQSPWRGGVHRPTGVAFERLRGLLEAGDAERLILDSGCGTGASTGWIARQFPDHVVIGVDRSAARLARTGRQNFPARQGACIWVQGELATFWRLAHAEGWRPRRHCILYPNPWPKPRHLARRWHAHPVFPVLLGLGGEIEMRTNWEVYAREFELAARLVTDRNVQIEKLDVHHPVSPFETKYLASGHTLWSVTVSG